jgi:DNA-directed RNA polymerases I and III subunit RPAC1
MTAAVNIESEGPYRPELLLPEAIKVMRDKISAIKSAAQELLSELSGESGVGDVQMADA